MDGCDVMLDQLYSYSPGLNALYAMSKGIVVVGGAEEEHLQLIRRRQTSPYHQRTPRRKMTFITN